MPALTARDLEARMTGQAEKSGGYVLSPSGFDPYEPGGVKSETEEVAGALVNGSSPGFHNAVCFENHQTDARTTPVEVSPTMGASRNGQASNNNPLVVAPAVGVVAIDMDKNKLTNADKPVRKGGAGFGVSEKGASYTLTARDQHAVAYAIDSMGSNAMKSKNPHSGCREIECAPTLTTVDPAPMKHQGGTAVMSFEPGLARREGALHRFSDEVASTLRADMGDNRPAVATVDYIVRRLTPLECERLQGLPDGYTKIPYRGKPPDECPDTPRYKALGNGWAVNCARWVCRRIQDYDTTHKQESEDGNE